MQAKQTKLLAGTKLNHRRSNESRFTSLLQWFITPGPRAKNGLRGTFKCPKGDLVEEMKNQLLTDSAATVCSDKNGMSLWIRGESVPWAWLVPDSHGNEADDCCV